MGGNQNESEPPDFPRGANAEIDPDAPTIVGGRPSFPDANP